MKYPHIKMVVPSELKKVENGKVPENLLRKTAIGGKMYHWAAASFNLLVEEAKKAGFEFKNIGDFRPYEAQLAMFMDRYSETETKRTPQVTRKFQGKTWYLKKGKSPSGTPGTSNHGLGLAIDICMKDGKTLGGNAKAMAWMCENAPKYGFYLQGSDPNSPEFEAWHWQYCAGDKVPEPTMNAVKAFLEAIAAQNKAK